MSLFNLTPTIDNVLSLAPFLGNSGNRRVYSAGDLLNDQTAGSAQDVQRQARVQFTNRVEARSEREARRGAEQVVEAGRVSDPSHESRQLPSFRIPSAIRA